MKACPKCGDTKAHTEFSNNASMCRKCKAVYAKQYRADGKVNKELKNQSLRGARNADKASTNKKNREYYAGNSVRANQLRRANYDANKDAINQYHREYHAANPHLTRKDRARRRATTRQATPKWHETAQVNKLYQQSNSDHHVDHVIPLQSDIVCGLHCLANLEVIAAEANLSKSNKFDQEYQSMYQFALTRSALLDQPRN